MYDKYSDYARFDEDFDISALKRGIEEEEQTKGNMYDEIPTGTYECAVKKLELGTTRTGKPKFSAWLSILEGDYKKRLIFMNQVITQGFQIHIVNDFLKGLGTSREVVFESFTQYAKLLDDIFKEVDGKLEYVIIYGEKNGYKTFYVKEIFEVED